jgi:glycine/D-amino acid oxidase-like deaminating enzyme
MQFSFWEENHYKSNQSILVIGSGIVGLSTAIELKISDPSLSVVVVEKYHPPQGASTKNAGFACFGSVSELMDDLNHMSEDVLKQIVKMRWTGLGILKQRLENRNVSIDFSGGRELFKQNCFPPDTDILIANRLMKEALDIDHYFEVGQCNDFEGFDERCILMRHEGQLNTMEMFNALYETALALGVKFIFGHSVETINSKEKQVSFTSGLHLKYRTLFLCTNGFTRNLFPQLDVVPARNLVCVTEEIAGLKWNGVYHFDKGYYYFRRIGNRILLGGARNLEPEIETTDKFEFNEHIRAELIRFLSTQICPHTEVKVQQWWTGILGIGPSKLPIIEELDKDCYIGVRLGGMGVAIGSYLGKLLVEKAKSSI